MAPALPAAGKSVSISSPLLVHLREKESGEEAGQEGTGPQGLLLMALQIWQKSSVKQMNAQFHSWFFPTVDTPIKMKIKVSLTLLSIFMKYLMVV